MSSVFNPAKEEEVCGTEKDEFGQNIVVKEEVVNIVVTTEGNLSIKKEADKPKNVNEKDVKEEETFEVKSEDLLKEEKQQHRVKEEDVTVKEEKKHFRIPKVEEEDLGVKEMEEAEDPTVPNSHDGAEDEVGGKRKKKRHRGESNWKSEQKRRRMLGQPYIGIKNKEGVPKEPPVMGPRCQSAAHVKPSMYCSNIGEPDREKIFKCFWENMNWEEKKMYVRSLVDVNPVRRRRASEYSRRSSTLIFFLKVDGERKRVCKSLFLSTLGIGEWSAHNWVKDTGKTQKNVAPCHRDEAHEFMKGFLQDFPRLASHYCRSLSSKQYLEPVFQTMCDLHKVYQHAAEEKMLTPLSRPVFQEEFNCQNLSLYHPKKDQCDTCWSFKAGNLPDIEWEEHLRKKEEACAAKVQDKNDANDKTMVVCMDLQALLLCPRLNTSALYYKSKLIVHNFTIYDMSTHNATCYVWHEGEGALSASEFASCVTDFLSEHSEHEEYILWSDGCEYQYRNTTLSNALLKFSTEKKKVVTQKFLEKGHTQMECDSVHSVIERHLKNQDIYVPAEYVALMKRARSKPNPYDVRYVDHTFFQDFTKLRFCKSICPGIQPGDPTVHDIRAIRYNINGTMDYKIRHSDNWSPLSKNQLQHATSDGPVVTPLYTESQMIKEIKYKHLQDLKEVIPKDFHSFYDNLKH
ncbi:hypothetical protein UPYG_G00053610 [Umbra pygmaea]|uniref:Uncharacterized protein n=1 Tax=Umbra pygmaea TaxID=75934 RepID=A0ABD0XBJ4_UMBPY